MWTNRRGTEYVWFNNVETKPGRAIRVTMKTKSAGRGPDSIDAARLQLKSRWQAEEQLGIFLEINLPTIDVQGPGPMTTTT